MCKPFFISMAATLILAGGVITVNAQQPPFPPAPDGDRQTQQGQRGSADRYFRDDEPDDRDVWRGPGMMERNLNRGQRKRHPGAPAGTMAFEMMGPGMGGGMVRMMMILMDSDGDGAVSLQEFQAGHERMFKAMDVDKDGRLTLEEVQNFGRSLRGSQHDR